MTDRSSASQGGARWARWVATAGGLGDRLPAPGTLAGSLPAAVVWAALAWRIDSPPVLTVITGALTVAATLAGSWAVRREIRRRKQADPGALVVDEIAGMWTTYLVACPVLESASPSALGLVVVSGFLLFRAFDVVKPWPITALERIEGTVGVMADDLAAGLVAGCGVIGIVWLS